jgi:hypothetical protein
LQDAIIPVMDDGADDGVEDVKHPTSVGASELTGGV